MMNQTLAHRRALTKLTAVVLAGGLGTAAAVPAAIMVVNQPTLSTTTDADPVMQPMHGGDGHDHDHGSGAPHGGIAAVPGVDRGVVLEEVRDNIEQVVTTGGTPHEFLVDTVNYKAGSASWNGPARFKVTSGKLPAGLILNADGTWRGTASTKGDHLFTVTVSNDVVSFPIEYRLFVVGADQLGGASWGSESSNDSQTITAGELPVALTGSGPAELSFLSLDTVPGIRLAEDGTWFEDVENPPVAGTYTMKVFLSTRYNFAGVAKTFTLKVLPAAPLAFTAAESNTRQEIEVGVENALKPLLLNNTGDSLDVSVAGGELPPGVTLMSNGSFMGAATKAGNYRADVVARNQLGQEARTRLTVVVKPSTLRNVAFTSAGTNTYQGIRVGQGLAPVVATGAQDGETLTYSLSSGELPDGITLNADGSFSGTASGTGYWSAAVMVSLNGQNATTALSVFVDPDSAATPDQPGTETSSEEPGATPGAEGSGTDAPLDTELGPDSEAPDTTPDTTSEQERADVAADVLNQQAQQAQDEIAAAQDELGEAVRNGDTTESAAGEEGASSQDEKQSEVSAWAPQVEGLTGPEATSEPTQAPEVSAAPVVEEQEGSRSWLLAGALGLLALVSGAVALVLKKRA